MSAASTSDSVRALWRWAKSVYPLEAAAELLVHASAGGSEGRFPVRAPGGGPHVDWHDVKQLTGQSTGVSSGGERRVLALVASLAGGELVGLYEEVAPARPGSDCRVPSRRGNANGSHDHSNIEIDHQQGVAVIRGKQPSLYARTLDHRRSPTVTGTTTAIRTPRISPHDEWFYAQG